MLRFRPSFLSLALIVFAAALFAQSGHVNAFTGTWKMDIAKSRFAGGTPPKQEIFTFQPDGSLLVSIETPGGGKLSFSRPWSGGREVALTGTPDANATMTTVIHGRILKDTWKVGGKVLRTARGEVSPNGLTLTVTVDGKDDQGRPERRVEVFDKQ